MKLRFVGAWVACYVLCFGCAAGGLLALRAALEPAQRERFDEALSAADGFLVLLALLLLAVTGFLAQWLTSTYSKPLRRLAEGTRLIASSNPRFRTEAGGAAEVRQLAAAINLLAEQRERALKDVAARVAQARSDLDEERNRLAALMSELAQSVVVCNAEGRILLYNQRARELFADTDRGAGNGVSPPYLGLGRSLFSLVERDLVTHFAEQLKSRIAQGESQPVAAFMIALGARRLLRARMAAVTAAPGAGNPASAPEISGYVLLLEDASEEVMLGERRDHLQQRLLENSRAVLGNIRAAVENLLNYPDADAARRQQFIAIINEEARRLGDELDRATREYSDHVKSHWSPEQIRAADLVEVIRRRLESRYGLETHALAIDTDAWVNVDSYTMTLAVCCLARRLTDEFGVRDVRFRVTAAPRHAYLELAWTGARVPAAAALALESLPLDSSAGPGSLTFREVVQRHHGENWYENEPGSADSRFRIALPLAVPERTPGFRPGRDSRPEYYDFDLFNQPGQTRELDDRPLTELTYTVFDTETTGLDPSAGDEIISIGAVRIVNGRILAGEIFDQLVDPRRPIAAASARIHGIRPEMLRGQPPIAPVLAAFHRFCEDTVLVGHNVAFDLRFLQLKEEATGVRFAQPVLDTLLLSAVLHDDLEGHELEAIAERYGVNVVGRHTAVGDAMVTGEIFLRMIPHLAGRGIVTLRQAREASQRTFHARVRY
jgi:DNA polymerase III subunit epsilon